MKITSLILKRKQSKAKPFKARGLLLVGKGGEEVHHPRQYLKQVATSVLEWTRCKSIGLRQIKGSISNTREVFSGTCPDNMRLRFLCKSALQRVMATKTGSTRLKIAKSLILVRS